MSQPYSWSDAMSPEATELLWLGVMKDGRYLSPARLREGMDQFNLALHEVARAAGVPSIDTSPMNGRMELFFDDVHLNEAGATALTELVVKHFQSIGLEGPAIGVGR
jgi:hypothetical protein